MESKSSPALFQNGIRINVMLTVMTLLITVISLVFLRVSFTLWQSTDDLLSGTERHIELQNSISAMKEVSDYLTDQARSFATMGDKSAIDLFLQEVETDRRRERALETVLSLDGEGEIYAHLSAAMEASQELQEYEMYSMRLVAESSDRGNLDGFPEAIREYPLKTLDGALTIYEKWRKGSMILHDTQYEELKQVINDEVEACKELLVNSTLEEQANHALNIHQRIRVQRWMTVAILVLVLINTFAVLFFLIRPMRDTIRRIGRQEELPMRGAYELQAVSRVYNEISAENQDIREKLSYAADHDKLTGLLNRRSFEDERERAARKPYALILADVDLFKGINDSHGHAAGDETLKLVADVLSKHFRAADPVCRIGGDEFAVIVGNMTPAQQPLLEEKLSAIRRDLLEEAVKQGLPSVTLSIGLSFHDPERADREVFKEADRALYQVKNSGRDGSAVYREEAESDPEKESRT